MRYITIAYNSSGFLEITHQDNASEEKVLSVLRRATNLQALKIGSPLLKITAKHPGKCVDCRKKHEEKDVIYWQKGKGAFCLPCGEAQATSP